MNENPEVARALSLIRVLTKSLSKYLTAAEIRAELATIANKVEQP